MKRIGVTLALAAALLLASPDMASAIGPERREAHFGMKLLDATLVRPLSLVGAIASTGLGLCLIPIVWPMGLADEVVPVAIVRPWRFTANRHLGDFRSYEDGGTADGFGIRD